LLRKVFPNVQTYTAPIPTYPSGYWSWAFCSQQVTGQTVSRPEFAETLSQITRYYNPQIHQAAFALPNFVRELVGARL